LAAHCIKGKKDHLPLGPEYYEIKFTNDARSEFSYDVSEMILHPRWDSKSEHFGADIAIAVLRETISFTPEVSKICFNTPNQPVENFEDQNATVAGWGYPDPDTKEAVLDLREVIVPIANQTACAASDRLRRYNADTLFCAGSKDGKTGPCRGEYKLSSLDTLFIYLFLSKGDSGGGLVLEINSNWTLVGLVSAGLIKHEVCDLTDYVLYTDVSKFYDWIYAMMIESF
jgi:secreted trypsin-like serine protease